MFPDEQIALLVELPLTAANLLPLAQLALVILADSAWTGSSVNWGSVSVSTGALDRR